LILDGTNGLSDVDGSAATPAIRGSDANTGVFFGTDIVGLSTGGSERVRVDASGNVGIGTSSPSTKLHVAVAGSLGVQAQNTTSLGSAYFQARTGVGSTYYGQDATGGYLLTDYAAPLLFYTNNTERARIDSSGNVGIGTSSPTARFHVVSNPDISLPMRNNNTASGTASATSMAFQRNGTNVGLITVTGTTTSYETSSDYRLKHDIQPMTGALAKVAALKPVTYKWNVDNSESQGFIAHELQEIVPECVSGEKDAVDAEGNPQYQGIDTSFLVATLTAAIQEQQAIITALTARVEALEGAQA